MARRPSRADDSYGRRTDIYKRVRLVEVVIFNKIQRPIQFGEDHRRGFRNCGFAQQEQKTGGCYE